MIQDTVVGHLPGLVCCWREKSLELDFQELASSTLWVLCGPPPLSGPTLELLEEPTWADCVHINLENSLVEYQSIITVYIIYDSGQSLTSI